MKKEENRNEMGEKLESKKEHSRTRRMSDFFMISTIKDKEKETRKSEWKILLFHCQTFGREFYFILLFLWGLCCIAFLA